MTTLTSLARAHAVEDGLAQPITTVRHLHVSSRPLVCVPLTMAGEVNAPLAMMLGRDRDNPRLLMVPQPRNRTLRFEFANQLALTLHGYLGGFAIPVTVPGTKGREATTRFADAPQVWVPNRAGIEFFRLLGRSTRFRSTTGPYAVDLAVPRLGLWLTFLTERAEHPGSSMLVAATQALTQHWATGQSSLEDGNLAAVLGWIAPPERMDGAQAALAAEDPLTCPPAGPSTDTTFDREVLEPAMRAYDQASDETQRRRAFTRLERAVRGQLDPTWQLMWQAIDHLRALPEGEHVARRWDHDADAFFRYHTYLAQGGRPQPKRDSAVAAAMRLNQLEREQAEYDAQRAFDDPLVMAEYRLTGDAFAGTVTAAEPDRRVGSGRSAKLRPLITVLTHDPLRLLPSDGPVTDHQRPKQTAAIEDIVETPDGVEITLELAGGMGRSLTPPPGTMPVVGDQVCYSALTDRYQPPGTFPARDDTPWTHGGPPLEPVPTSDDAQEEWS